MTQAALQTRFTVEDLLALPSSKDYELVDGVLVEREAMGAEASVIASRVNFVLSRFVFPIRLGYVFDSEATYQCFGTDANGRRADVSFIRRDRLPGGVPTGALPIPADLAVEVVSPNDKVYDVNAKVRLYLRAGFRLVWVLTPGANHVDVHRLDGTWARHGVGGQLTAGDVLPGFTCDVSELFEV